MLPHTGVSLYSVLVESQGSVPGLILLPGYRLLFVVAVAALGLVLWGVQRLGRRVLAREMAEGSRVQDLARWFYAAPLVSAGFGIGFAWFIFYSDADFMLTPPEIQFWSWIAVAVINFFVLRKWDDRKPVPGKIRAYALLAPIAYFVPLVGAGIAAVLPTVVAQNELCRDHAGIVLNKVPDKPIELFFNRSKVADDEDHYDHLYRAGAIDSVVSGGWENEVARLEVFTEGADQPDRFSDLLWQIKQPGYYRLVRRRGGHPDCQPAAFQFDPAKVPDEHFTFPGKDCLAFEKLEARTAPYRYLQQPSEKLGTHVGELAPLVAEPLPDASSFKRVSEGAGAQSVQFYQALVHDPSGRIVAEVRDWLVALPVVQPRGFAWEGPAVHSFCRGTYRVQGNRPEFQGNRPTVEAPLTADATAFLATALDKANTEGENAPGKLNYDSRN